MSRAGQFAAQGVLGAFVATLLMACAVEPRQVYEGPRLTPDKEARISTDSRQADKGFTTGGDRMIHLVKINGQSLLDKQAVLAGQMHPYPSEAYVLPGRQELDVRFAYLGSTADARLWFVAQAGKEYRVRHTVDGYKVAFWIEDIAAGKPVGGVLLP